MNCICLTPTSLAFSARSFAGKFAGRFPAAPASVSASPSPARMAFAALVCRLPFRHAQVIAERFDGVEIGRRPSHRRPAPFAYFCKAIRPARIWFSNLSQVATGRRTILLLAPSGAYTRLAANLAGIYGKRIAKAGSLATLLRAKGLLPLRAAAVLGMKRPSAPLAQKSFAVIDHIAESIAQLPPLVEIKERYCDKLQQEVLAI